MRKQLKFLKEIIRYVSKNINSIDCSVINIIHYDKDY